MQRMPSGRDSTRDILLQRNETLDRTLRETKRQLSAALHDNKELRRQLGIRRFEENVIEQRKTA